MVKRNAASKDVLNQALPSPARVGSEGSAGFAKAHAALKIALTSGRDFERFIADAFQSRGFTLTGFGGDARDGGIELGLTRDRKRYLVQCKHWKKDQVGVTAVKEMHGVMLARAVQGGFLVTSGQFTPEARRFALDLPIELLDGSSLTLMLKPARTPSQRRTPDASNLGSSMPKVARGRTPKMSGRATHGTRSDLLTGSTPKSLQPEAAG